MTEASVSDSSNSSGESSNHYLGENSPLQQHPELRDGPVSSSNPVGGLLPLPSQYHSINRK